MSVLSSPLSIDDILITPELQHRVPRLADYAAENQAMMALALEMANNPQNLLQLLVQFAQELCQAGSAGISLLEDVDGETVFRWPAISGAFAGHVCGSAPREFSPCGIVLDRGAPQLYSYLARHFTYMQGTEPEIIESLVIPIHTKGEAVGTMWVLAHDEQRRFDAEDTRLLTNLGNFTAAALQVIGARDLAQQSALKIVLAHEELETQVQERTQALHSANAALQESTRMYRALADATPQMVWTADPDGTVDYYNERWYAFTGFPRDGSVGDLSWKPILHPDDVDRCLEVWYNAVHTGQPYDIEYRFLDRVAGDYLWFLGRALPMRNENGEIVKWVGTCTNIQTQKAAEAALRRHQTEVEDLNARLRRAMTETHHRVKNNLQIIAALVDMQTLEAVNTIPVEEWQRLGIRIRTLAVVHDTLTDAVKEKESAPECVKCLREKSEGDLVYKAPSGSLRAPSLLL